MRAVILLLTGLVACTLASKNHKVVCYFGSWAVYRPGRGNFNISDIDASLCTHLIYTFVGVTNEGDLRVLDPWADLADNYGKGGFRKFNALRSANPNVKTMIAMGGWNEGSQRYSEVVSRPEKRKRFVKSVLEFIKKHGFDGFDLDWEYPNQRGGQPTDKENFVSLLTDLSMAFKEKKLILSAAVAAAETSASKSYLIAKVTKYLDFINLMTYDFHGKWDENKMTGINAPLYAGSWEKGEARGLNVEASVKYWISQGAEPKKLVLGVPFYGRSFRLADSSINGVGAPFAQEPEGGPYTRELGFLGYNEICEYLKDGTWQKVFQEEQRVPYAYKGNLWVGYDDERSLEEKASYVKKMGLGGMMVWSIETDDFKGNCGKERYPLLKAVNRGLQGHSMLTTAEESTKVQNIRLGKNTKPLSPSNPQTSQLPPASQQILSPRFPELPGYPDQKSQIRPTTTLQGSPMSSQGTRFPATSWNIPQGAQSASHLPPLAPEKPSPDMPKTPSSPSPLQDPQKALLGSTQPLTPPTVGQTSSTPGVPENIFQVRDKNGGMTHFEDSQENTESLESGFKDGGDSEDDAEYEDEAMPNPPMSTEAPQKMTSNRPETLAKPLEIVENQNQKLPQNLHTPSAGLKEWSNRIQNSKPAQDSMKQKMKDDKANPPKSPESTPKPPMRETARWPPTQRPGYNPQNAWPPSQIPPQAPQIPQRPLFSSPMPPQYPGTVTLLPQRPLQNPQIHPLFPPGSPQSPQGSPMIIYPGSPLGPQVVLHGPSVGQPGFGQNLPGQNPPMYLLPSQVVGSSPLNAPYVLPASTSLLQEPQQNMLAPMPKPGMKIPESQSASDPKIGLCKKPGFVRDPEHCHVFYQCELSGDKFRIHKQDCTFPLKFNPSINACDHAEKVQC